MLFILPCRLAEEEVVDLVVALTMMVAGEKIGAVLETGLEAAAPEDSLRCQLLWKKTIGTNGSELTKETNTSPPQLFCDH